MPSTARVLPISWRPTPRLAGAALLLVDDVDASLPDASEFDRCPQLAEFDLVAS